MGLLEDLGTAGSGFEGEASTLLGDGGFWADGWLVEVLGCGWVGHVALVCFWRELNVVLGQRHELKGLF